MKEGWLIDRDDCWIWRFWRDENALVRDPKVFIDRGRLLPEGPPLLKQGRRRAVVEFAPEPRVETTEATCLGCCC